MESWLFFLVPLWAYRAFQWFYCQWASPCRFTCWVHTLVQGNKELSWLKIGLWFFVFYPHQVEDKCHKSRKSILPVFASSKTGIERFWISVPARAIQYCSVVNCTTLLFAELDGFSCLPKIFNDWFVIFQPLFEFVSFFLHLLGLHLVQFHQFWGRL